MKRHDEIRREIRAIRAEMKAKGIRRLSCFNAGHSADSYRLNARMFELEYRLKTELKG
jgi:phage regulator Rha-like protein